MYTITRAFPMITETTIIVCILKLALTRNTLRSEAQAEALKMEKKNIPDEKKQRMEEKLGVMQINVEKIPEKMDIQIRHIKEKLEHAMDHNDVDPSVKIEVSNKLQEALENSEKLKDEVQDQGGKPGETSSNKR